MDKDELIKRLLAADADLQLCCKEGEIVRIEIGGGSALILCGVNQWQTPDIDVCSLQPSVEQIVRKYGINSRMRAFTDILPYNYEDRLQRIDIPTKVLDCYFLSREDVAVLKLCSDRDKDVVDVNNEDFVRLLDWDLLDKIAKEEFTHIWPQAPRLQLFYRNYEQFKRTHHRK